MTTTILPGLAAMNPNPAIGTVTGDVVQTVPDPRYRSIVARAKRYGDTKRGPYCLTIRTDAGTVAIVVSSLPSPIWGQAFADWTQWRELDRLSADEATSRLCDIIERLLFEMREAQAKAA